MPKKDFFVVAIGASAGGLDAIQQLFDCIPNETGMAFVIVQHLSPNFKSLMPELLAKHTGMKIYTSEDNQEIKPNCIYLNQKNKNLYVKGGRLFLLEKSPKRNLNLPIDIFFHSLAEEYKDKAVGVVLSGTGSDGSRGIKSIKEAGGILMVQTPDSAQFDGMPNSSINTGLIDFILPPEKIAETLTKIPNQQISLAEYKEKSNRSIYFQVLDLMYKKTGINFKQYKKNSLLRRLEKQMNINNFTQLYDYFTYLKNKPEEIQTLKQDFLIGVTGFFRDEEAFEILKTQVIPELFQKHEQDKTPVRVWVPGCSTGEEAYTIAFLLDDFIKKERLNADFKIFATDINEASLRKAGNATYSIDLVKEMPLKYIDTYFINEVGSMKVIKRIRDKIVFSKHNLLKDPPFIRLDLISCRNLLIYIETNMQSKVLQNFQFSLRKDGYLLLGSSESLGHQAPFFTPVSSKWKIYQCLEDSKRLPLQAISENQIAAINYTKVGIIPPPVKEYNFKPKPENTFYKYVSENFAPAIIFTDTEFNILFVNGDITTRLAVNQGMFQGNLLKLVNKEIAIIIRSGIRKAEQEKTEVQVTNVTNKVGEQEYCFDLAFRIIENFETLKKVYLIHFSQDKPYEETKKIVIDNRQADDINKQRIFELEDELKTSKSQLQYMVEQLETSNEELQSSNEELMASNEELQSTNEELQSVNEELYTVNTELQQTNKELSDINNDVNNLLNATEIGTLFLNVDLKIRKFTPALQKHFKLQTEDIGRSIAGFAANFTEIGENSMLEECKIALNNLKTTEAQVSDHEGEHYLRRISPFITADKKIDGLVVTFTNITPILNIKQQLSHSEKRYQGLLMNTNIGVVIHNQKGDIVFNNSKASDLLRLSEAQMQGKELFDPNWNFINKDHLPIAIKDYPAMIVMKNKKVLTNKIFGVVRKENDIVWLMVNGFPVLDKNENVKEIFISFIDITENKKAEQQVIKEKNFSERISNTSPNGIYIYNTTRKTTAFSNRKYARILGYKKEEMNAFSEEEFFALFHPEDLENVKEKVRQTIAGKHDVPIEFRFKHKKGHWIWLYSVNSPFEISPQGEVTSIIGSFIDLSDKKKFEKELQEAKKKAEIANIYKNQFLANMSHEIRTPLNGVIGFADLLDEDNIEPLERRKYINIIKDSSNQLLKLVNDIIDISKIEANELKLEFHACKLHDLFKKLETTLLEIKKQKSKSQIELKYKSPPLEKCVDLRIITDPLRLWQVMTNLINNALNYSERGLVEFGYELPDKNAISFFVKDEGSGIPKEKLKAIFNRFERLDNGEKILPKGTGLGLAITKGIITLLNGTIELESEVGKGTNFKFTMPLIKVEGNLPPKAKKESAKANKKSEEMTILVAEDTTTNIEYFKCLFKKLPYKVLYANNGLQAVEMYKNNPEIEVVLMDIKMPIMNGEEASKKIFEFDPNAKIIAQTAHAMHTDLKRYLDIGFADYVPKPIDKEILLEKLNRLLRKKN